MNVLVFTSLYPNNVWPYHGVFVKERVTHVVKLGVVRARVVAPVPYFPAIRISRRWLFSQVERREMRDGLEVYHPRYFMVPKVGMVAYGLTMFLSVLPIVKKLRHHFDFDVIDAHFVYPDGFAAVLLGAFFRKPVVLSARGSDITLYKGFPFVRRLLRYTLCHADKVIAVARALKEAMVELGVAGEKIRVIPNGVDVNKFHPVPKAQARRQLGLPPGKMVLSVGNLLPVKGFDLLIKAFKILVDEQRKRDLFLVIVGEGEVRNKLRELAISLNLDDRVRLVGNVAHEDLYLWYSAADLFCLASSREGWPNVLLEALACGTPVVATAVGGVPEIIVSESIGLLAQRGERQIAASIAVGLNRSWDSMVIRQYAHQHSWERAAISVLRTFEAVLEDRSRPGEHVLSRKAVVNTKTRD